MNRNIFFNTVVTIILFIAIICGFVFIQSVDLLRQRTEDVAEQLKRISGQISSLEKQVQNQPAHIVTTVSNGTSHQAQVNTPDRIKMANAEFYDTKAATGGRLVNTTTSETKNLNSIVNNESFVSSLWSYAYDSIADRNYAKPEVMQPQMAESWSLSDDKMVYTIKLKKGILWHDFKDPVTGKEWQDVEVTAHDFKFYVDVIKNEDVDCAPARGYFKDMKKIEVINDYEFKVYWQKKYFKSEEITLGLAPLPRHLYHAYEGPFDGKKFNDDHQRNRIIVGCGPYRFTKWDKGQRIILERWDKYYGKKYGAMPALKTIVIEIIKHPNTQFQALVSKEIDRMGLLPEQWVNKTKIPAFQGKTAWISKFKYPSRSYAYMGYNLKNPLFSNKTVRQALTHLVNRKRIIKDVLHNLARITTGPFFLDSAYYNKSIIPYPFSIEKAKQLFKQAGWQDTDADGILDKDGKKFEFVMLAISSSTNQRKILQFIKEDMAKAGVVMKIINVEWPVYTQRLENKDFEACFLGWRLGFTPDPYQIWHSSQADATKSSNHISFRSSKADKLIEEIRVCFDLQKRIKLCHEFHKLLHEEQPYTFLYSSDALLAESKRYKNARLFPAFGVPTKLLWTPSNKQKPVKF